jgi:hypothetical protein
MEAILGIIVTFMYTWFSLGFFIEFVILRKIGPEYEHAEGF